MLLVDPFVQLFKRTPPLVFSCTAVIPAAVNSATTQALRALDQASYPACLNTSAKARPMPPEQPVINATLV